ncbi:NADH-ubiquinone oxidoreductase chain E [hydrothermal vent metagenome]|uniref:NADH-ubiquinone oxidoreductase chain E n=1 Tax=hydrothermal vent metagenome TaxID=652676 RepID=A0A3B0RGW6_9ZZZZ
MLSDCAKEKIKKIYGNYVDRHSVSMTAMQIVQREIGHLTEEDLREIAEMLDIKPIELDEVGGFYTMYNVERPVGKYHVQVCENLPCALVGAEHIITVIEKHLKIKVGETTPDKKYTLSRVQCLGSCGTAPMMQVNEGFYEDLTEKNVKEILDGFE